MVTGTVSRVEKLWRITRLNVQLHLGVPKQQLQKLSSVLAQFEDFCVVTQSVRSGIKVDVDVIDSEGVVVATGL
jgi:organic hydroperoxide reductase OsmC/OhrA